MLFHIFQSQAERINFGGSDFIEIQYCRLPPGTEIHKIVSVESIEHWKNDSLYIFGDDMDVFYQHYGSIIADGIYNNEKIGPMDLYGINFYSLEQTVFIMERIKAKAPVDYQVLLKWLHGIEKHIGFYILGL